MKYIAKYIPLGLFTLFAAKLAILGGSYESALILAVLAAASAFYEYKSNDKALKELQDKFKSFEEKLVEQEKLHKDLVTHVHGLKLSTSMKSVNRF